ncbi:MAG: hypothetical protein AB8H80_13560 [Planctomycetota bacterium]
MFHCWGTLSIARMPQTPLLGSLVVRALVLATVVFGLVGCAGRELAPSVWPPPDFLLAVEELRFDGETMHVVRRMRVGADGTVFYGTSSRPMVDDVTGTSLPVFDRLAIYQLEPICLRALARKLDRLGIDELPDVTPPPAATLGSSSVGVAVRWQAFQRQRVLTGQDRARGPLAEILAVIAAHLPQDEGFDIRIERPVVSVLSGVPAPVESVDGALAACRGLLASRPEDVRLLQEAFVLACAAGHRREAEELLERWRREMAHDRGGFGVDSGAASSGGLPRLDVGLFMRLLPPA